MLTETQGRLLVRLVRQQIEEHLNLPQSDPVSEEELADPIFQEKRGVFVTLHKREALRGCIGSLVGVESILAGIKRHALNAAFHDSRFQPVSPDELRDLHIEVSVLSEPQDMAYSDGDDLANKLRPEIDGLILRAPGGVGATFLPQVWKQLPDPKAFLSHLCSKAGLAPTAWKTDGLEVQTYQVQYFEEPR
ncbi:AmmeMemoRadiSam system protein A [Desulfogranum marinum]|uniref:AmmeMemoRadiSam system protein A n=1 Tax=Desulfogranum marinum TaxID=453220 RepID=UPI001964B3A9|nr:AmmeMemoRadiSam system protein A [Desulfogranum marinum]MBM9513634.1 AmmeMemoRadiSam system protein A [Desulfogranum marinum]